MALILFFFCFCWNLEHILRRTITHFTGCLYWFSAAGQDLCLLSCTDRRVVIYPTQNRIIYCYKPGVWKFIDKQCCTTFPAWVLFLRHVRKVDGTGARKHLKTISIVAHGRPVVVLLYTCLSGCCVDSHMVQAGVRVRWKPPLSIPPPDPLPLLLLEVHCSVCFSVSIGYLLHKLQTAVASCKWWPVAGDMAGSARAHILFFQWKRNPSCSASQL